MFLLIWNIENRTNEKSLKLHEKNAVKDSKYFIMC